MNVAIKKGRISRNLGVLGFLELGLNCLTRESESLQTSYKRARLSFGTEFVEVYFLQMSYKEKGQNLNVTPTKPDLFRKSTSLKLKKISIASCVHACWEI